MNADNKQLVVLSSRGDYGYDNRLLDRNHLERSIFTAFAYLGINQGHQIAVEYDEFGDERLTASIVQAEQDVDKLVHQLQSIR